MSFMTLSARARFCGLTFMALLLCAALTGCASTASWPQLSGQAAPTFNAGTAPIGPISADAAPGVAMTYDDLNRIAQLVHSDLIAAYPARLVPDGAALPPGEVKIDMTFTTYDPGNSFARFMLAGLGQIHIDATVRVIDMTSGAVVATYQVNKTFAWGGAYGGSVTIRDVEKGFAASVANIFKPS